MRSTELYQVSELEVGNWSHELLVIKLFIHAVSFATKQGAPRASWGPWWLRAPLGLHWREHVACPNLYLHARQPLAENKRRTWGIMSDHRVLTTI